MITECPYLMPTKATVCSIESLLYFIYEREAINQARINGHAAPWTADPILAKYKFTNVHRRDDRGTKWIIDNLIMAGTNRENSQLWFTLVIARLVNWPPTLQALIDVKVLPCTPDNFDAKLFETTIEGLKAEGKKVYTGAYMVYPANKDKGGNKSAAMAEHIIGDVITNAVHINNSLWKITSNNGIQSFVDALSRCFGVGTFIAGQVAADLTYAPGHLDQADDLYTYAPVGPGSSRGLNYLHDRKPNAGWNQEIFNLTLMGINDKIIDELDIHDMTLHDVQNCMCEFSKYCRTMLGEGSPKSTYKPELEY